jgi:GNAT superfamily N-acetyltransferase
MRRVRRARPPDVPALAAAVRDLLVELGGEPPGTAAVRNAAQALLDDSGAGAVLVAEASDEIVGVLAASWVQALHAPAGYGLIQQLWVDPAWRRRAVAHELMQAFLELARDRRIERVEVGLPRPGFAGLGATQAFYRASGFTELGVRMRRTLALTPVPASDAAAELRGVDRATADGIGAATARAHETGCGR